MKVSLSQTIPATHLAEQSERIGEVSSSLVKRMQGCDNVSKLLVEEKGTKRNDAQELKQFQQQNCQALLSFLDELGSEELSPCSEKELTKLKHNIVELSKKLATSPNYLTLAANLKNVQNIAYGIK